ncbi:MAG: glutamine--fructose-6-phosphate transaminase (isomerizing) [Candidatus Thermoplasmatota archaeon]|nr:glutamine--fructose-6-phosphate transaminase (isomerizing) [Euryarchaeota archaeon]MBU4031416.1 glutamine--fructose-6-phosphate transaminase (isomerizing) [Candidatus Thermoplasmatota archaeon]MBU4071462.1 glutamine--fructose-6-phosphate transaminase (isomerizing) [Candidatus Thermoplasmatota archaeon]MBU4144073.1 glutamine--fructose-6-phosphate transaminase (isomerizing) [Candidatus Thermoplasmatota archaeon]MBU4592243.1 glutamine--fructose-6-phosphate transaminase (isomerizing) [Candidatus
MCGIIGYTGNRQARDVILSGLKRLEYRGYDSAGIAIGNGSLNVIKDKGDIDHLISVLPVMRGKFGIGHTRWATHGPPIKNNSHPMTDCKGQIALVHNGIIENNITLREELMKRGHVFRSETDTEVAVHLLEEFYDGDLEAAMRKTIKELKGSFALVAIHNGENGKIVGARNISPLVVGVGKRENFLASDVPAILEYTDRMIYLLDGEVVTLTKDRVRITNFEGKEIKRSWQKVDMTLEGAEKGGYDHFMLKEIFEQPKVIQDTIIGANLNAESGYSIDLTPDTIKIIACGTSYHAGYVGKYMLEELTHTPTTVELASEYRFSSDTHSEPLVIGISQSGETTDTLSAIKTAQKRGLDTLGIVNIVGSTMTREADSVLYTRAGLEVGVAATKTYITQLVALLTLSIKMGVAKETLGIDDARHLTKELRKLPKNVRSVLDQSDAIYELAQKISGAKSMFFLGRNINFPVALEGALKMKEISYIHAEGYPGGELKHGPLALVTEKTPVIAIAVKDQTYEKMLGNIGEVSARGATVIAIGTEGDRELDKYADYVFYIPDVPPLFTPILTSVVMQLLAYHTANILGCEIDKPRHLAKSVTVE